MNVKIRLPIIVLGLLVLAIAVLGYYYYYSLGNTKTSALLGGLLGGLVLVMLQFLFNWYDYNAVSKLQSLKVIDILLHRDDRVRYQNMIDKANTQIDVLGVTASRFMEHFADDSSDRNETSVLQSALQRNVEVRILVPSAAYLGGDEQTKHEIARTRFKEVAAKFPNFRFRYFDHVPAHSIVRVDDECIIGPVFPGVKSKHTPAILIVNSSPLGRRYLEYFETEWESSR